MKEPGAVLDSSVWIEILSSGPALKSCKKALNLYPRILVPTLVIFEVYRKIASSTSEDQALAAISVMTQYEVVELTQDISLLAGDLSLQYKLDSVDSLILAHAHIQNSILVTLDYDFHKLPGVKLLKQT